MYLISKKITTSVFAGALCFCCLLAVALGRDIPPCPHAFVVAALYSRSGDLWVATEGEGLLKLSHDSDHWEKQKGKGLPGTVNFLSLVEDRQGRIWAGTDNQGVAVWNGESWMQYNQENALLGERVPALAVSPLNGDVAIATSGGLTIYSAETEEWKDFTRANGLPEDQIVSLSFNEQGGLWAAFLTNGIGYASPASRYSDWKMVQTKFYWDKEQRLRQPVEARGKGLPSNFSNAVCSSGGSVWVGTMSGLGYGRSLSDWKFLRGMDYEKKNEGLWLDKGAHSKNRKANSLSHSLLLPEDYITCFYPVPGGMWAGFRESGVCFIQEPSLMVREVDLREKVEGEGFMYVTCFVGLPEGDLYAGTYGHGLVKVAKVALRPSSSLAGEISAVHPRPPVLPVIQQIKESGNKAGILSGKEKFEACYWYEDWATQGDWCERYGRSYAMLCAMNSAMGDVENDFEQGYVCIPWKGPHVKPGDTRMKYSVIWSNEPKMRNILYCPESTTRTLAQWDDDGENYPRYFDGPDLGAFVEVPEGRHQLSLYFHDPRPMVERAYRDSLRDYIIEIRKFPADFHGNAAMGKLSLEEARLPKDYLMEEVRKITGFPALARSRVKSFAGGGVYKNFILNGKGYYYIRIVRNYSTSVTLNGIFLSSLDETKAALECHRNTRSTSFWYGSKTPAPPAWDRKELKSLPRDVLASWGDSQNMEEQEEPDIFSSRRRGIYAYRHLLSLPGLENLKSNWRWRLKIWNSGDKNLFLKQMDDAWKSLQDMYPIYRSGEWAQYAPEKTIPFSVAEVKKMHAKKIDWKQYLPDSPVKPERTVEVVEGKWR